MVALRPARCWIFCRRLQRTPGECHGWQFGNPSETVELLHFGLLWALAKGSKDDILERDEHHLAPRQSAASWRTFGLLALRNPSLVQFRTSGLSNLPTCWLPQKIVRVLRRLPIPRALCEQVHELEPWGSRAPWPGSVPRRSSCAALQWWVALSALLCLNSSCIFPVKLHHHERFLCSSRWLDSVLALIVILHVQHSDESRSWHPPAWCARHSLA